jgi:mono/diheme cytochrome c family protein
MKHNIRSGSASVRGTMTFVASAYALLLAAGTSRSLAREPAPRDLRLFYQQNCAGCHGADGAAQDAQGKSLRGQDFTDERWRKDTGDAEMVKVILNGKFFGLAMPSFKGQLTGDEAQRFVSEILRPATKGKVIAPEPKTPTAQQP